MDRPWTKDSFPTRREEDVRTKRLLRHVEMSVGDEGPESEEEMAQEKAKETPAQTQRPL